MSELVAIVDSVVSIVFSFVVIIVVIVGTNCIVVCEIIGVVSSSVAIVNTSSVFVVVVNELSWHPFCPKPSPSQPGRQVQVRPPSSISHNASVKNRISNSKTAFHTIELNSASHWLDKNRLNGAPLV